MPYEYLNTRVRLLKSRLLRPEQMKTLLDARDLPEYTHFLSTTDYVSELQRASVQFSGYQLIEETLLRNSQRCLGKLYQIAPHGPRELIEIFLERFAVFNLKTILRGKHVGADPSETLGSLYPTIIYPLSFYEELVQKQTTDAMIDYLLTVGHRYYKPLAAAFAEYQATGKLAILEQAIDAYYFAHARSHLRQAGDENAAIVRVALGTEADILNLVYALRVVEEGLSSDERYRYILPGGERLGDAYVRDLIDSPDRAAFFRKLEGGHYARALGSLDTAMSTRDWQERLENYLYQENCRFELESPFDIHLARAYIWRKMVEMTNLRVVASGLLRRAPREEVEKKLISIEVLQT